MDSAIHQSLAFLCLLLIGLLLKFKIKDKKELKGIKTLILCVALPATIFVALLKIELTSSLIALPILGLAANFLLYFLTTILIVPFLAKTESGPKKRTYLLLLPSFAPGLSCFPFIIEYLGDQSLANAALADVGNKIFVLIILYLIAMKWFYARKEGDGAEKINVRQRVQNLSMSLLKEPVNAVILIAIILLLFGQNFTSLPLFVQDFVTRAHALTTGMILVFIGVAFNIRRAEAQSIISLLLVRSGTAFILSALVLWFFGNQMGANLALLLVIFPQSSCSFWPLAHMSAVEEMEGESKNTKTFDIQAGLNVLACSLPFSSILILGICTSGTYFIDVTPCTVVGLFFILGGIGLRFFPSWLRNYAQDYRMEESLK